jgi:hypothetical protein
MGIKSRSKEELISLLADQSKEHKKELIILKESIKSQRKHEKNVLCRLAVVMAYAHWEGFIQTSSIAYVQYVEFRSLKFEELAPNFQALAYKRTMLKFDSIPQKIFHYIEMLELADKKVELDVQKTIKTNSNLNYKNFENICQSVGINCQNYWSTQKPFIDELVANRCRIAHGGLDVQSYKYADEVLEKVIEFIDNYRTDLENLAVTDACFCRSDAKK